MLASKSDYFHSLNRKSSGPLYNPQCPEPTDSSNYPDPIYSPLRKTDSLRELGGTGRSFPKTDDTNPNGSFGDRNSRGVSLNISQLDYPDYNRFFENFDKIFKVSESSSSGSPTVEEATQKKNICRVLLDDFEGDRAYPPVNYFSGAFHPDRSLNGFPSMEVGLPQLEYASSKPYIGVKTEPSMTDIVPYKLTDYKEICRDFAADRSKGEGFYGAGKGKLPDLKVPKTFVNRLNNPNGEGSLKINEVKNNKFLENGVKVVGKVRVNVPVQAASNLDSANLKHKNSQQALEKIIKPKKYSNITRCKTFVLEGIKDKGQIQNEERMRVNSLQGIENGSKTTMVAQKNDVSLDLGPGSKSKFFLKGFEQRTTAFYSQPVVNKTQNEVKNTHNNVTSRNYYSKENLSFLSNSSRDKAFEAQYGKYTQEGTGVVGKSIENLHQVPSSFQGQTVKMGVEEISKLYKDLRQSIKITESQKPVQHIRINAKNLKPLSDAYNNNAPQR